MEKLISIIEQSGYGRILISALLVFSLWFIRSLATKKIRKSEWQNEDKRKWLVMIRNWTTTMVIAGLITVWATELQTFALSVVAITGAMIIAGKELLLCVHGGMLRSFNNLFKVGDRIEVGDIRGDVIDTNLFITKIMEIGPSNFTHQYTGRSIVLPNSHFLTKEVINESFMHKYVLHVFKLTFKRDIDWEYAEKCMLEATSQQCSEFIEAAQKNMDELGHREGLEVPKATPRITYKFSGPEDLEMIVRVPAPATKKGNIEQLILKSFMKSYLKAS